MIPLAVEQQIVRLLQSGMSQRRIAAIAGVSRGTVASVRRGDRRRDVRAEEDRKSMFDANAPTARCRICGAMVLQPCLACRVRPARRLPMRETNLALGLDMKPEHRARYEKIRAARAGHELSAFAVSAEDAA